MMIAVFAAAVGVLQEAFADSNGIRTNLDKLILLNILHRLLKRHFSDRSYSGGIVFGRRANVGKLFGPCGVYGYVVFLAVLADHLPGVNLLSRLDEKDAPVV